MTPKTGLILLAEHLPLLLPFEINEVRHAGFFSLLLLSGFSELTCAPAIPLSPSQLSLGFDHASSSSTKRVQRLLDVLEVGVAHYWRLCQ